jgi:hypothetical protein
MRLALICTLFHAPEQDMLREQLRGLRRVHDQL